MKTYRHHAFGVTLQSDINLPMLLPAKKYARAAIRICAGNVDAAGFKSPITTGLHYQVFNNTFWLRVPGVARFLLCEGKSLIYQRDKGVDDDTLVSFLQGTCLGVLLQQRGFTVLRAMAVKFGQEAVIFASPSGAGKSFLAAAMHKIGYTVITDDLCVIDDKGRVLPGYPVIKIWRDCLKALKIVPGELKKIRPQVEKYVYPLKGEGCQDSVPVTAVYLLSTHNKDDPEMVRINGRKKILPLLSQTHCLQNLQGLTLASENIHKLITLAGSVKVTMLTRPQRYPVARWIELIESDFKGKGVANV